MNSSNSSRSLRSSEKENESVSDSPKVSDIEENVNTGNVDDNVVSTNYEPESFTKTPLRPTLRERIFLTVSEPSYSTFSYCLSFYFYGLVALSMVLMCSETVVAWSRTPQQQSMWRILETVLTMNFLVDFLIKLMTAQPLLEYILTKPTFTIDLLGLAPYFTERLVERFSEDEGTSIKALRVLRLLRFFRLSRIAYENFPDFRMFIQAVRRSKLAIAFLGMYVFGAGLFFASCIYFAETSDCFLNSTDGIWYYLNKPSDVCSIQNMYEAWWFTLVTMTTVGYGDKNVYSAWGRILTVMIMISSLIFLALPSAIFAANLTEMYLERRLMTKKHHNSTNSNEKRPNSPVSAVVNFFSPSPSPREDPELETLLSSVDASSEQIQSALTTLTVHLSQIHHHQQQIQNLLNEKKRHAAVNNT